MAKFTVLPGDDEVDMRSNWMLHKNGSMVSSHVKKSAAVSKMRDMASKGDTIELRKTNGQIQAGYPRTYEGSASQPDSDEQGMPIYGAGTFKTGVSDFF